MKNYVKTYHDFFGLIPGDFLFCEGCGGKGVEIHHLRPKSLDKKAENKIENLICLCRSCHDKAHSSRQFNEELKQIHRRNILKNGNQMAEMTKEPI